jgi:acetyl esterase/lipase
MSANTPTDSTERSREYRDVERDLRDDSRADPRMVAALAPFGFDHAQPPPPVSASSPHDDLLAYVAGVEEGFGAVFAALFAGLPPVGGVTQETTTILGPDDNEISLVVHRPTVSNGSATALPCVVHFHGGGGVVLSAHDASYMRWRDELAASGLVVVGVEFRNAGGRLGVHPYPAGLGDCAAATEWLWR